MSPRTAPKSRGLQRKLYEKAKREPACRFCLSMAARELVAASLHITSVMCHRVIMALAQSKLTAQGQISVPAAVRRKLGLGPGSVLEWDEDGERIVVRRAGRYSSEEIHRQILAETPKRRDASELKEGIRQHMRKKHARR